MKLPFSALATALLLLGGCGGINGQTPAEMIRHSMSRQISHDNQYEFSGRAHAEFTFDENAAASGTPTVSEATDDKPPVKKPDESRMMRKLITGYGKAVGIPYHGAADWRQGKWEIVPALEVKTRNLHSLIRLPLQLDLKRATLYADPEALTYWTDMFVPEIVGIPAVNDRYLALTLPESSRNKIPLRYLAEALPKAVDEAYAALPAETFARLEMDGHGRTLGAAHRIGAKLSIHEYGKMGAAFAGSLHRQLAARTPPVGMTQQDYQKILDNLEKLSAAYPKAAETPSENPDDVAHFLNHLYHQNEWYLDKKGRLLGAKDRIDLPDSTHQSLSELFGKPTRISLHNRYTLHYTKQPQFLIRPNETNTWDISCLLDKETGCEWLKKSPSSETTAADTETETPAAPAPRKKNKRRR